MCYEGAIAKTMNIPLHDTIFLSYLILKVSSTEHVALPPYLQAYLTLLQLQLIVCLAENNSNARVSFDFSGLSTKLLSSPVGFLITSAMSLNPICATSAIWRRVLSYS